LLAVQNPKLEVRDIDISLSIAKSLTGRLTWMSIIHVCREELACGESIFNVAISNTLGT
jgi:hypothetical protein